MGSDFVLPKGVKGVVFIERGDSGASPAGGSSAHYASVEQKKKKKKQNAMAKMMGKFARRLASAGSEFSETYLERHDRSLTKHRDGWVRDYGTNMMKAQRAAFKKLKMPVFFKV
jgi:hypothetical protein